MTTNLLDPRKALHKAFLKIKPVRTHIELFKAQLIGVLDACNEKESEEFHKNLVIDFLKKTYYDPNYFVNTKGRNDLVIHNGKDAKSNVGVIIEVKSPTNKTEMVTTSNLNGKALQELVLYYLRERITHKNTELKHLVVSNIYEWFVFDAQLFNKVFAEDKKFVKQFVDFEEGRLSGKTTDYFYKEIAKPFIDGLSHNIEFAHFDIRKYDKPLRNADKADDRQLIALFKLLSPEHLLKLSFVNDSNSLDKNFYTELLHLIGLTEVKDGGKKLIERHEEGARNAGSLLENAIVQLDSLDKISRLTNPKQYGDTYEERLFTVALELTITWVNRILFLKLLEAQLISYHKGDTTYSFLNSELLHDYDNLNGLFFQVLAKKTDERNDRVKTIFAKVPYLNSSLFEPTDLEHETLFINMLEDNVPLKVLSNTVMKDGAGKKLSGTKNAIDYFFAFLDAYDFASEGSEEIQEDNKTLINASVLGLIFEKINGYKDGSFFTPGFITMYMCKETLRRAVVQKFNETKGWNCTEFEQLYDKIEDRNEANNIINSLKICDPAVGSGHFLVSALNEMIAIKYDLRVLLDREGKRLKEYQFEVVNDELIVTDDEELSFQYNPTNKESQRVQETLFHEKQTIIENCLFGVDINPNSVKICRLRLWIELLKNAYYKENKGKSQEARELETLPNIDINIKCGNSLISRFGLDADLKKALKQSKWNIESYKLAVDTYRNAESKEQKHEMERLIADIKGNFRSEIGVNDPKKLKLEKLKGELFNYTQQVGLFERSKKEQTEWNKKVNKLSADVKALDFEIEEIKSNKIYENAFEWRFEFPEVLNDDGDFVGFDVVIGNPPYFSLEKSSIDYFKLNSIYKSIEKRGDIYTLFYELGMFILKKDYSLSFITSSTWMRSNYGKSLRKTLIDNYNVYRLIDFSDYPVFDSATVLTNIIFISKQTYLENTNICLIDKIVKPDYYELKDFLNLKEYKVKLNIENSWSITSSIKHEIRNKIQTKYSTLKELGYTISNGFRTGFNESYIISESVKNKLIDLDIRNQDLIKPLIRGRDIKKYTVNYDNLYVIIIAHGKGDKLEVEYPSLYYYLLNYEKELKNRGQVKNGQHHWLELDNHPNEKYLALFENTKITYPEITKYLPFYYDKELNYYSNNKTFFINGENLELLVSYLNSKLFKFLFLETFPELQGNSRELRKVFMEQIPVKIVTGDKEKPFINKVNQILSLKKDNPQADTSALEHEIDLMVYELYGLSEEEVKVVEES